MLSLSTMQRFVEIEHFVCLPSLLFLCICSPCFAVFLFLCIRDILFSEIWLTVQSLDTRLEMFHESGELLLSPLITVTVIIIVIITIYCRYYVSTLCVQMAIWMFCRLTVLQFLYLVF